MNKRNIILSLLFIISFSLITCSSGNDEVSSEINKDEGGNKPQSGDSDSNDPLIGNYEWNNYKVPIKLDGDMKLVLNEDASDEFKYTSPAEVKSDMFNKKWIDSYHNAWTGPGCTVWKKENVSVSDGYLKIKATRPSDVADVQVTCADKSIITPQTYMACITSKVKVKYPLYIEAYAKIANNVLASTFWMLSSDDTQEIDVIEAYGADRDGGGYGADRLHLSHHVFVREPFKDYQPNDVGSWYKDSAGTIWRKDFHRIGVYWKDPYHLEYYVDGNLVRTVDGKNLIDPYNYTNGSGLNKELDIIVGMEDQSWRTVKNLTPTNEEIKNEENNTYLIDWIRVYNIVSK